MNARGYKKKEINTLMINGSRIIVALGFIVAVPLAYQSIGGALRCFEGIAAAPVRWTGVQAVPTIGVALIVCHDPAMAQFSNIPHSYILIPCQTYYTGIVAKGHDYNKQHGIDGDIYHDGAMER